MHVHNAYKFINFTLQFSFNRDTDIAPLPQPISRNFSALCTIESFKIRETNSFKIYIGI